MLPLKRKQCSHVQATRRAGCHRTSAVTTGLLAAPERCAYTAPDLRCAVENTAARNDKYASGLALGAGITLVLWPILSQGLAGNYIPFLPILSPAATVGGSNKTTIVGCTTTVDQTSSDCAKASRSLTELIQHVALRLKTAETRPGRGTLTVSKRKRSRVLKQPSKRCVRRPGQPIQLRVIKGCLHPDHFTRARVGMQHGGSYPSKLQTNTQSHPQLPIATTVSVKAPAHTSAFPDSRAVL